jgi:hypothetical protein
MQNTITGPESAKRAPARLRYASGALKKNTLPLLAAETIY